MSHPTAPLHATLEDRPDPAARPRHPIVNGVHHATEASAIEHIAYLRRRGSDMALAETFAIGRATRARLAGLEIAEAEGRALGQLFHLRELAHDDREAAAYQRRSTPLERARASAAWRERENHYAALRVAGAIPNPWRNA